ncbi:MAG: PilZ domain-containing protein [Desulfobacterales bacterium]|jgi:c-di-GMP-binding flagellar brake protein YcgR
MEYDQITDNAIKKVFESLIKAKILIKLRLSDTNYEQLTVLTGFRRKLNRTFFLLGYPDGFKEAAGNKDAWEIDFEFTGPDRIPYSFSTTGGEIYQNQLCLPFPDLVYRNQRRKFFRLEAPEGTMVEFVYRQSACREQVVDISVGGALIAMVCHVDETRKDLPFQVGDALDDVDLVFPSASGETRVQIKKAIVVRFDRRVPNTATCCGLEFIEIEQNQVKTLTDFIYKFQRNRLRHRMRPDL